MSRALLLSLSLIVVAQDAAHGQDQEKAQAALESRLAAAVRSPKAWHARRREIRQRILVSAGLWPEFERPPLQPVLFSRLEREGYAVEKVRIDRDGHRGPRRRRRTRAAVEPVPSCLRRLRCTCEIESNLERGEGTLGAEPKDVPGARVDVERRRERERSPRRELRPYHAVPRGVNAPEIPHAEPLRGRREGRRRR